MKLEMDTIQFESRREIETIITALDVWQDENGEDPIVQELIDKLDVMHMNW